MSAQSSFPANEASSYEKRIAPEPSSEDLHGASAESGPVRTEEERYLRTKFLRRVAHDIASPVGVTMTVLDELAASAEPALLVMARRGLKRLLRLSEQLALLAELETGELAPEPATSDLSDLVKQAVDAAVSIDGRRDVTVTCALDEAAGIGVSVDRRIVHPILREIVGNAIRIASSRVLVDIERTPDVVRVRVHDDGPGFSAGLTDHIGERFTARVGTRGLGISLSMAKEILAAHGGQLSIERSILPVGRRGVGAAVIAELRCARGPSAAR